MIELHNIDCMEYMKGLDDNAFELAIVDPPYGIDAANTFGGDSMILNLEKRSKIRFCTAHATQKRLNPDYAIGRARCSATRAFCI